MLRVIRWVAALNLAYFGIEFSVAAATGSVSLFADSIDFLEDSSINLLILIGIGWRPRARSRLGTVLAGVLLVPTLATVWTAWQHLRVAQPAPPAMSLSLTGAGALVVNLVCAIMLARHRDHGSSLLRAAFLSARNDVFGNVAILIAGALTAATRAAWPDLAVGLGLAVLNITAAGEVLQAARAERHSRQLFLTNDK